MSAISLHFDFDDRMSTKCFELVTTVEKILFIVLNYYLVYSQSAQFEKNIILIKMNLTRTLPVYSAAVQ
jgi:hypothetical protein